MFTVQHYKPYTHLTGLVGYFTVYPRTAPILLDLGQMKEIAKYIGGRRRGGVQNLLPLQEVSLTRKICRNSASELFWIQRKMLYLSLIHI